MKKILLFGAGKSATVLIDFLTGKASEGLFELKVADANLAMITEKTKGQKGTVPVEADIRNEEQRGRLVQEADIVISLMPPALHILIARDCLKFEKHLLTASYADEEMKSLHREAKEKGLLFLCEMGLDPGIDHMSAMEMIHRIQGKSGKIISFKSHCGGLVAPESDDNPWHYKISWNPRNIVTAGKQGALYRSNGKEIIETYEELFDPLRKVMIGAEGIDDLGYYPNRNSFPYIELYGLESARDFIRTTLRHQEFISGWKNIIELKLTDETTLHETAGKSLQAFFSIYLRQHGFEDWFRKNLSGKFNETKMLLDELTLLIEKEKESLEAGEELPESMMMVDETGNLQDMEIEDMKAEAASAMALRMHEANIALKQLFFLGLEDNKTIIRNEQSTAADVLQQALETKLALKPEDKDLIVMLHEIEYELNGENLLSRSLLMVKGEDSLRTAMAKTVGLPLGIAAMLLLEGKINNRGVLIPIMPEIYNPVLEKLRQHGIRFSESETEI